MNAPNQPGLARALARDPALRAHPGRPRARRSHRARARTAGRRAINPEQARAALARRARAGAGAVRDHPGGDEGAASRRARAGGWCGCSCSTRSWRSRSASWSPTRCSRAAGRSYARGEARAEARASPICCAVPRQHSEEPAGPAGRRRQRARRHLHRAWRSASRCAALRAPAPQRLETSSTSRFER